VVTVVNIYTLKCYVLMQDINMNIVLSIVLIVILQHMDWAPFHLVRMACALHRVVDVPVGGAGTPDDISYSSDFVQDTRNRLRQLEAEAEVRHLSQTCNLLPFSFSLDYSNRKSMVPFFLE